MIAIVIVGRNECRIIYSGRSCSSDGGFHCGRSLAGRICSRPIGRGGSGFVIPIMIRTCCICHHDGL